MRTERYKTELQLSNLNFAAIELVEYGLKVIDLAESPPVALMQAVTTYMNLVNDCGDDGLREFVDQLSVVNRYMSAAHANSFHAYRFVLKSIDIENTYAEMIQP